MQSKNIIYKFYYQWWKNIDKPILLLVSILFIIGLFFSLVSTSLIASDKLDTNNYFFFFKHLIYVIIGVILIFIFSSLNQDKLYKFSIILFFISLLSLFLVPIIGIEVKGSKRWIDLFFLPRFQPIEIVKPFLIVIFAIILCKNETNILFKYLASTILMTLVSLLLIIQPDIGQTLLVVFSWAVLIFCSGINLYFLLTISSIGLILLSYMIIYIPKFNYIKARIFSFFDKETGTHNFQSDKAIESITSGGFFGKGIGEGTLKNRVPEAHTDYIIAIISEEYGSIISTMIIFIFLYISFRIVKNCINQDDNLIKISLCGLATLLIFQTFIHVGVNTNLIPTTGMTLPFLSYGGSSLVGSAILAGVILNYTKNKINLYE